MKQKTCAVFFLLLTAFCAFGGYRRGELIEELKFDAPVPGADWVVGGGKSGDGALHFKSASAAETSTVSIPLQVGQCRGIVQIEADVKGVGIGAGEHPWNGPKVMFPHVDARGPQYPEMPKEFGSYDWKTKVMVFEFDAFARDLRLVLGLEAAPGEMWVDAVRIYRAVEIADDPNAPTPRNEQAERIPRGPFRGRHNPAALRGVMSGNDMSDAALDVLRDWNANLVRLQISIETKDLATMGDWFKALDAKLDWAADILSRCRVRGMKAVIDLHGGPGCIATKHASNVIPADYDPEPLREAWRRIARRFKDDPSVYGYDILNEPSVDLKVWDNLFLDVTREIRKIDPRTPVITEFCHRYFEGENVIYSVHFYSPHSYTHAGVVSTGSVRWSYPGYIDGVYWNVDQMRVDLEPWIRFSLAHPEARILVGEFSAIVWARGCAAYLRDAIAVFEEYGWDWTYHAFREWPAWDVEYTHVGDHEVGKWRKSGGDTLRKAAVLEGLSYNRRPVAVSAADLRAGFANPPDSAKLQMWWHWIGNHVGEEGIRLDLKAMAEVGVSTAYVFSPNMGSLPPNALCMTPEWLRLFGVAIREAKRNGIMLGFHNCPGWSSSGGPWIAPENSMKKVVSSALDVDVARTDRLRLPQPQTIAGYYRDIAVYAFPVRPFPAPRGLELPKALGTKTPGTKACLVLDYPEAICPRSLLVTTRDDRANGRMTVEAEVDGGWKKVGEGTFSCWTACTDARIIALKPSSPARRYRLTYVSEAFPDWMGQRETVLTGVQLSELAFVPDLADANSSGNLYGYHHPPDPALKGIDSAAILDLTRYLAPDGTLDLASAKSDDPSVRQSGNYRVVRLGCTSTGRGPAPTDLKGLECDKLDPRGIEAHWAGMPAKILALPDAKDVVKYAIVDSYEVGGQNWTAILPDEFRKRRGYGLGTHLLSVCGYVIGDAGQTADFLWDFQRTVSELFEENYYARFAELCRENGMEAIIEPYGGPFETISCGRHADIPTGEFWLGRNVDGTPRLAASIAHLYGKTRVASESFTTDAAEGRWLGTPAEFRRAGDAGWLAGVNQIVFHSYVHQPWTNLVPGLSLGRHGSQFNRNTTWWPEARHWAKYVQRGQFLLQSGRPKTDVLTTFPGAHCDLVAAGYSYDFADERSLRLLHVQGGRVFMPGCEPYEILSLHPGVFYSPETCAHLAELEKAGARIVWENPLAAVRKLALRPPVEAPGIRGIRRRMADGTLVSFLLNGSGCRFDGTVSLATGDLDGRRVVPMLYDAKSGAVQELAVRGCEKGRVSVDLGLEGDGSVFVVLQFGAPKAVSAPPRTEIVVRDLSDGWMITSFTGPNAPSAPQILPTLSSWSESSDERLRHFAGRAVYEKEIRGLGCADGLVLDLGSVREIANVSVNGKRVCCLWEPPYRVDLSDALKGADGFHLRIEVVNTWPNRLIGDALARKRGAAEPKGGYDVPQWVLDGRDESGTGIFTWSNWLDGWKADDKPLPAGLLGPVRLLRETELRTAEADFADPPSVAKPQTWWHWMNGNVTREGVTADLEAMARIGLGGAHVFDAGCGIPAGPVAFDTDEWYAMLTHACREAKRLGLELTLSNCSGWSSSGGPWVRPVDAMKYVETVSTNVECEAETSVEPPKPVADDHGFYEDIATLAFPTPADDAKIPAWKDKIFRRRLPMEVAKGLFADDRTEPGPGGTVKREEIRLGVGPCVMVPPGRWTVVRIGYACNGQRNHPASFNGGGLECDKLASGPVARHFDAYAGRLLRELGVRPGRNDSAFRGLLVDSYETDCQNWTQGFAEEFRRRKGYPLDRFLPTLAGFVVDDLATTEAFLKDYRRVIADLFAENYAGTLRRKCDEFGLNLYLEPYGNGPFEFLQYGARATIPMGEFWCEAADDYPDTARTAWGWWCINGMCAPVAHVHGKRIVASESFSAVAGNGRWRKGPFEWKATGDKAFCDGVTRIVYHRFAHQPWTNVWPGMTMGGFGSHFERTLTWWDQGAEWIRYQSRCQTLLQRGDYIADVLFYRGDEPVDDGMFFSDPLGFGWKHDTCCQEDFVRLVRKDGRIGLLGGTQYGLLVLPEEWRNNLAAVRARLPPPDFDCEPEFRSRLSWIHRRWEDGSDAYFVACGRKEPQTVECSFRVVDKAVEFWHPDTGRIFQARDVRRENGRTIVPISFDPCGSVFVVFRTASFAPFEPLPPAGEEIRLDGSWKVTFTQKVTNGEPKVQTIEMPSLRDWTSYEDPFIRYFSGTAVYETEIPPPARQKDGGVFLDLGEVRNVAEVFADGKRIATLWKPPFRCEIPTEASRLEVHVTNYWVNRLIGDERLKADCEYLPPDNPDGPWGGQAVKEVPEWVKIGRPSPTGRSTFATWRHYRGDEKPLPSGLLGPVVVTCP